MHDAAPRVLSNAVRAARPMGSVRVARELLAAVLSHCPTRARYSNPEGPPVAALPAARPKEV